MKVDPLSEAKSKLSRYGSLCHDEPVVVTVNGRPSFQLVPLEEDDDLIQQLIEQHPGFRDLPEKRLRGRTVSVATATRQLARGERHRTQRS
jgi:antitoxin (DNA-binding transcriptional repressor) of toxin-antitoxin stability system